MPPSSAIELEAVIAQVENYVCASNDAGLNGALARLQRMNINPPCQVGCGPDREDPKLGTLVRELGVALGCQVDATTTDATAAWQLQDQFETISD